jgi:DNA-binding PadR family transcriptional regulator
MADQRDRPTLAGALLERHPQSDLLELSRLEETGLVEGVGERGPRARHPYRITDAGRLAFREWLEAWAAAGPRDDQLRSPLVLTVFFGGFLDPGVVERLLHEYRLRHQRMLESRRAMLKGLSKSERESLPAATLDRGIALHETTVAWLDRTIRRFKGRSQARPSRPTPANSSRGGMD